MKTFIKYILQKILGFKTYLYIFALFVIVKIRWDNKEKDFFYFVNLLPEEGLILDLGANIGVTSYHLAKARPKSTVLSFEPLSVNMNILKRLKKKFKLNNIKEYLLAIGNENTTLKMVMPVINKVPMHGLSHALHHDIKENNSGIMFEVPMVRLDDFKEADFENNRITGFKIDVENFEYFVLQGAKKLIEKHQPVIYCELWENESRGKCISLMNNLGYAAFVLHKKELLPFNENSNQKHNFFFLKNQITN